MMRQADKEMIQSVTKFFYEALKHLSQIPGARPEDVATAFAEKFADLFPENHENLSKSAQNERALAVETVQQMLNYLQPRRSEKSNGEDDDSDEHVAHRTQLSKFGARIGTKRYIVDTLLESAKYTKEEMMESAQVSDKFINRRMKELRDAGYRIKRHKKSNRIRVE